VIAVIVETKILLTHVTPPQLRHTQRRIVSDPKHARKRHPVWNRAFGAMSCELLELV
jgi:hypothetical protein